MGEAGQQETKSTIQKMITVIDQGSSLSDQERNQFLSTLSSYECWYPYLKLLENQLKEPANDSEYLDIAVEMIRVRNLHLQQQDPAVALCQQLVKGQKLTFQSFHLSVLPRIITHRDYPTEVLFCRETAKHFVRQEDQVSCLEHLAMLYDKRLHSEKTLRKTWEQVLSLDPDNVRALRFFKTVHAQAGSWDEVAQTLQKLLKAVSHQEERHRVAQELAGVLLYQLQQAEECLALLDQHCSNSLLDSTTLEYDARASLKDWTGCLQVLEKCLDKLSEDHLRAVIFFRMAPLHQHLNQKKEAIAALTQSSDLWPQFLEPLEELVHILVKDKEWSELDKVLQNLGRKVQGDEYLKKITQLRGFIASGISHGAG